MDGSERFRIAESMTKQELLKRMYYYVVAEAKQREVPEWSIVGHIFGVGSGVAAALWSCNISQGKAGEEHDKTKHKPCPKCKKPMKREYTADLKDGHSFLGRWACSCGFKTVWTSRDREKGR